MLDDVGIEDAQLLVYRLEQHLEPGHAGAHDFAPPLVLHDEDEDVEGVDFVERKTLFVDNGVHCPFGGW